MIIDNICQWCGASKSATVYNGGPSTQECLASASWTESKYDYNLYCSQCGVNNTFLGLAL
jgi:hypothetical protein